MFKKILKSKLEKILIPMSCGLENLQKVSLNRQRDVVTEASSAAFIAGLLVFIIFTFFVRIPVNGIVKELLAALLTAFGMTITYFPMLLLLPIAHRLYAKMENNTDRN